MRVTVLAGVLSVTAAAVGISVLRGPVAARLSSPEGAPLARMADAQVSPAQLDLLLGPPAEAGVAHSLELLESVARQEALRAYLVAQARHAGLDRLLAAQTERAVEQILVEAYLAQRAAPPQAFPPEAMARAYYAAHRDQFRQPERYRVAHIYLARPPSEADAQKVRARAGDLARQAAQGDFASVARTASEHPETAARGGVLGWVAADEVRPDLRAVVAALPAGTVSDPVELPDGWHILRVDERAPAQVQTFKQAQADIRTELRAQEAARRRQVYLAEVVRVHPVTVDEIGLRDWQSARVASSP